MTEEAAVSSDGTRQTSVDLGGLLTVVSEHLYSTPMVAIRELVQNGHDSITRRRFEDVNIVQATMSIHLSVDETARLITVTDTGAGLTEDEVHRYLATIGTGYTRRLRSEIEGSDGSDLIGLFGIGFLSAFVVADAVEVTTTSFQDPSKTVRYSSSDGQTYRVDPVAGHRPVGTEITLRIKEHHGDLVNEARLDHALRRYATLLSCPITIGSGAPVNDAIVPWRDDRQLSLDQRRQRDLEFAANFEHSFEPICTTLIDPLGVNADAKDVQGLLWIQGGGTYGTSDNRNLSVFVRRMLLDDDARDLLPRWAGFVGGVIESATLTPTASREDLQRDDTYEGVKAELADVLINWLERIATSEPDTWRRILRRHNTALVGAALADERLFRVLDGFVTIPTTEGDLTVAELHRRTGGNQLHVTLGFGAGFEDVLLRAQKIPVAKGEFFGVLALLQRFADHHDAELIELGSNIANRALFAEVDLPKPDLEWLAANLAADNERIVAARFAPAGIPLVTVADRDAELKRRLEDDDLDDRASASALKLARLYTNTIEERPPVQLFVNVDNPAIAELLKRRGTASDGSLNGGATDRASEPAFALLRSVKALLAAPVADSDRSSNEIAAALDQISHTVGLLLGANLSEDDSPTELSPEGPVA